jgi:hypothetical protein
MSLRALQESLQSAAWTPPQRRFFEQLIAYVLPRTLLPGSGIDITQDAALGTLTFSAQAEARTLVFQYDISGDETTTLTTGTAKRTWRMPIPFTLRSAYASLTTGSSSGAVIVDVNADNSSVFGTNKLSIDQGEESSFTATTAVDLTEQLIDADVELTFDVDDDGTNAVGLKVYLVGVYAFDTELLMFGPLDDMTVGAAYSDTLSVIGGIKPYSITTPQSLPDGITATLNGGNNTPMTISGTPTGAGLGSGTSIPFLIRATVQDAANDVYTFSQTVTITVAAVVATIDGGALPDATVGVAYSHDIDATGGVGAPYIFSLQSGTLPAGITLDSSTGALTGTPTTAGTHTLTFRATDSEGNYGEATDTFDVVAEVPCYYEVGSSYWGAYKSAYLDGLTSNTDYTTASRSAMGASLSGSIKYYGSVLGTDGKIYCVPSGASNILIIDPAAGTASTSTMGASFSGSNQWSGGVLGPDGKIYCIPRNADTILIIDPAAGTAATSAMGASLSDSNKWIGGVLAPNGKIYCMPFTATDILIIDPAAGTASRSAMGLTLPAAGDWAGGVLGPDGKIYGIPYHNSHILIIDPVAGNTDTILIIDPAAGTAATSAMGASLSDSNKFNGVTQAFDGNLYACPATSTTILKISEGADPPDDDAVLSGWVNKL